MPKEGDVIMTSSFVRRFTFVAAAIAVFGFAAGCGKKVASKPPAAPPAPATPPTVTMSASPETITSAGQTVTLSWTSTNATDLTIDPGVGRVSPQGSTPVNPTATTTYTITATGPGGSVTGSARVTLGTPPPPAAVAPPTSTANPNVADLFAQNVQDAYFALDKSDLDDAARAALTKDAEFFRTYPQVRVSLEGHCDERGSTEYNLGLGQRRADAAKNFLISLGISGDRVTTTSWGKEKPFCTTHDESCWLQNRRAHFVLSQ